MIKSLDADLGSLLVIAEKCILISKLNFFKFISCLEVSEIVRWNCLNISTFLSLDIKQQTKLISKGPSKINSPFLCPIKDEIINPPLIPTRPEYLLENLFMKCYWEQSWTESKIYELFLNRKGNKNLETISARRLESEKRNHSAQHFGANIRLNVILQSDEEEDAGEDQTVERQNAAEYHSQAPSVTCWSNFVVLSVFCCRLLTFCCY